jgi:hypothetical protein
MRSSAEQTAATPENTGVAAIYKVKLKRGTFFAVKECPPSRLMAPTPAKFALLIK